ncbi:hypothetical protein TrispH2_005046 [Trichoplax sp. H2]|nr:hypothetical protein TrispH2_005046 [Trichoplax sp. H2]|eukprot:RDD43223.1 hypothetical protein TrispH2_005046 [Trichoplax sp. H2]
MENWASDPDDDSDVPICHSAKKRQVMIKSDSSGSEDISDDIRTPQDICNKRKKSKLVSRKLDYGQIGTSDNDTHSEDDTTFSASYKTGHQRNRNTTKVPDNENISCGNFKRRRSTRLKKRNRNITEVSDNEDISYGNFKRRRSTRLKEKNQKATDNFASIKQKYPENNYDISGLQHPINQSPSEASSVDSVQLEWLVSDDHESNDGYKTSPESDVIKNKGINQQNYHYDGESANQSDNASSTPPSSSYSIRRSNRIATVEKNKVKEVTALKERLQNRKAESPESERYIISDSEDIDSFGSSNDINSPMVDKIIKPHDYNANVVLSDSDDSEALSEEAIEVSEYQARRQPFELTKFREKMHSLAQPLKECFCIYIQYIASVAIDDQFADEVTAENVDYFLKPKNRIESLIDAKVSILQSTAWQSNFKASLEKYPMIITYELPGQRDCEEIPDDEPSKKSINSQYCESDRRIIETIINDDNIMDQFYNQYQMLLTEADKFIQDST